MQRICQNKTAGTTAVPKTHKKEIEWQKTRKKTPRNPRALMRHVTPPVAPTHQTAPRQKRRSTMCELSFRERENVRQELYLTSLPEICEQCDDYGKRRCVCVRTNVIAPPAYTDTTRFPGQIPEEPVFYGSRVG